MGYTYECPNITLTSEEETRLCGLGNGDLDNDDDVSENQTELKELHRMRQHLKRVRLNCRFQDYQGFTYQDGEPYASCYDKYLKTLIRKENKEIQNEGICHSWTITCKFYKGLSVVKVDEFSFCIICQ